MRHYRTTRHATRSPFDTIEIIKFDVTDELPRLAKRFDAIAAGADFRDFPRTPILSREAADVTHITRGRVHAIQVRRTLPWLYKLYRDHFLELAAGPGVNPSAPALDDRYGVVLNVLRGTARCGLNAISTPTR